MCPGSQPGLPVHAYIVGGGVEVTATPGEGTPSAEPVVVSGTYVGEAAFPEISVNAEDVVSERVVSVKDTFDIAPSDMLLCAVEQELAGVDDREKRLLDAIERLEKPYDFVIIDCPPSIGHLCFNALRASSEAIIPIDMSLFSLRGVAKLTEMMVFTVESYAAGPNLVYCVWMDSASG